MRYSSIQKEISKAGIFIARIFNAGRKAVWTMWTDPLLLKLWWGPKTFTSPISLTDFHVGGIYLFSVKSPDGQVTWSTGTYLEISEPERMVFTDSFANEKGEHVPASQYGLDGDWPDEMLVAVTFEELGKSRTRLTLRQAGIPGGKMRKQTELGWNESFDKLAMSLNHYRGAFMNNKTEFIAEPGKPTVIVTHEFDAPRDRVFKYYTDPKLIPKWWGPRNLSTSVDKMSLKPGGTWHISQCDAQGHEFIFKGVYHEISKPERIVETFEYEGMPGHVLLSIVKFDDDNGKTKLTETSIYQSIEDRDGMLNTGMEAGEVESMDRLEELLTEN